MMDELLDEHRLASLNLGQCDVLLQQCEPRQYVLAHLAIQRGIHWHAQLHAWQQLQRLQIHLANTFSHEQFHMNIFT